MNRERMKELGKARLTRQNQRTGQRTGAQVLRVLLADGDDEALQVAEEDQSVVENTMVETTVVENTRDDVRVEITSNYHRTDNDVSDLLARLQTTAEQSIYRRLYRLSYGFHRNTCRVGMGALAHACNIGSSAKTVKKAIDGLIEKGHISVLEEHGNSKLGTLYRVYLPCEVPGVGSRTIVETTTVKTTVVNSSEPTMVETTVVENTTPSVNGVDKEPEATVVENTVVENTGNKDNINKNSLSPDLIVDLFYTGLGQEKISKEKRERAIKCIEELKQDGFFIDDIAFAVQWTLNHSKEKPYDFSILKHTMGQALAAQEKDRQAEERRQEKAKLMAEKEAVEKEEAEKTEKVNAYKESLSPEERKRLRSKAEAEILETGDYKREFITDALISTTENKILRQEGVL